MRIRLQNFVSISPRTSLEKSTYDYYAKMDPESAGGGSGESAWDWLYDAWNGERQPGTPQV